VLFFDPLKPIRPALDQEITPPLESVIVMIVLLNVDWMWATPYGSTRLSFRFFFSFGGAKRGPPLARSRPGHRPAGPATTL
jgi:hypothetical protein